MALLLKNFEGLYGDNRHPFIEGFIHHELLDVRSRVYDWTIDEHLHTDLMQVFLFMSGNGVLLSGHSRVVLAPPCVVLVPANTLHGFAFEANMKGEVLTIAGQSLETFFNASPHILLGINQFNHLPFRQNQQTLRDLQFVWARICAELTSDYFEKELSLQLWVQQLVLALYRMSIESEMQIQRSDNRTLNYFQTYQKLIRKSVHEVKSVQEYAKELNITTVHLNRICRALVKKSALQVVHDYLTDEAKKYLLNTAYSLSEISYLLNFKDPAYFSRFFKKQVGVSPGTFRR